MQGQVNPYTFRFVNYINPKLKPGKLTQTEIAKLFECYNEYGPQWSLFENKIKGRYSYSKSGPRASWKISSTRHSEAFCGCLWKLAKNEVYALIKSNFRESRWRTSWTCTREEKVPFGLIQTMSKSKTFSKTFLRILAIPFRDSNYKINLTCRTPKPWKWCSEPSMNRCKE